MARFSQEYLETLSDKVDIVDLVSDYVTLKSAGRGYVGLCPFHREKTPSFHVSPDKQLFYCFGCQASGTIYNFVMKIENLEFVDAVKFLADRVNLPLPESSDNKTGLNKEARLRLYEANRLAARFYHDLLYTPEGEEALAYLHARGVDDRLIRRFGLGYSPNARNDLVTFLKSKGFSNEELLQAGLAVMGDHGARDFFRNRVMFPIISANGQVLAFGGRVLDKTEPKYLNTGDTPIYNKRKNLYALNVLRKSRSKRAIIVEGYMDVIALNSAGFDYAVASCGTALTRDQLKLLNRSAPDIYVSYDGDSAGINATHKVLELARNENIKIKVIQLEGGLDPDEYIKANGQDAYLLKLSKAKYGIDFLLDEIYRSNDMSTDEGKAKAAIEACAVIKRHAYDSIETELHLRRLNKLTGFSMEALYKNVGGMQNQNALQLAKSMSTVRTAEVVKAPVDSQLATERAVLALLIAHPHLMDTAVAARLDQLLSLQVHKELLQLLQSAQEGNTPLSMHDITLHFAEDNEKSAAVAAVCMADTVYVEPGKYLRDSIKTLYLLNLEKQREVLKKRLTQYTQAHEYLTDEEFKALINQITELDKKIAAQKMD